ncbi:cytochrome c oxidase assembly protein COX16-domain-containing protein [Pilobolus umbonatus]|nr:cytochrome c oxidase assembly protein COX16-domain-containing protein [Pilobolus umbonatus]
MGTFQNKPYNHSSAFNSVAEQAKKKPFIYFGLPFLAIMVVGSFGLAELTKTKFEHRDRRHTVVAKEEALGIDKNRRTLSLQEEYMRLQAKTDEDWEQVRISRPPGQQ